MAKTKIALRNELSSRGPSYILNMKEIIIFPFRNEDPFKNGCVQPYCIFHNALFEMIHYAFGSMAVAS